MLTYFIISTAFDAFFNLLYLNCQLYNIVTLQHLTILPSQGLLKETLRPRAGNYGVTCGPGFSLIRHRH